ncbi:hypothetical protein ACOSQ2_016781 [Xanthoceras sorbifolium]
MFTKEQYAGRLPPRRGQVLIKILKEMFGPVATTAPSGGGQEDDGGHHLGSTSPDSAGAATPGRYNSDAESES